MKPLNNPANLRIGIARAEGDRYLVMSLDSGSQCDRYQLSLAQARALSLELIKLAYQAELRSRLSQPEKTVPLRTQRQF